MNKYIIKYSNDKKCELEGSYYNVEMLAAEEIKKSKNKLTAIIYKVYDKEFPIERIIKTATGVILFCSPYDQFGKLIKD